MPNLLKKEKLSQKLLEESYKKLHMRFLSYYRTRSYSSNNSSFLFYLEVISYH